MNSNAKLLQGRSRSIALCALLAGCGGEGSYPGQCGVPLAGWRKPTDGYYALAIANHVTLKRDGAIQWNGKGISAQQLAVYSSMLPKMDPIPFTILQIDDGTNCSVVREVREMINNGAKCIGKYGSHCGEGAEPWARIGDVVGPNGETYKFYPDRNETVVERVAR